MLEQCSNKLQLDLADVDLADVDLADVDLADVDLADVDLADVVHIIKPFKIQFVHVI